MSQTAKPETPVADMPGIWLAVTVLAVSSLTVMANATISPSLPGLVAAFTDTPGIKLLSGLVLSLPSLSIILTAGLFGRILNRVDRRKLVVGLLVIYGAAGASGAIANSIGMILVGRVLLGAAVGGTMTLATTLAGDHWSGAARERFLGQVAAAMAAGGIAFLLLGGLLAEWSWRGPFLVYLAAWPLVLLAWAQVPPDPPTDAIADPQASSEFPWRTFAGIGALAFFGMAMFYLVPVRLPFHLQDLGITAPSAAGLSIAAMTTTSMIASLGFARLRARVGPRGIFVIAFGLMAAGYMIIGMAAGFGLILTGGLISGLGMGLTFPNQSTWLLSSVPPDCRARAAGMLTTAVFAGQFASPFLSGGLSFVFSTSELFFVFAALLVVSAAWMLRPVRN